MPSRRPLTRRPGLWIGLGGLVLAILLGATGGKTGVILFAGLYLAVSAAVAILFARTWWGPMRRGVAGIVAGALLVGTAVGVGASADPSATVPDAAASAGTTSSPTPSPSRATRTPEPAPSSAAPTPKPKPKPATKAKPTTSSGTTAKGAASGTALAAVATLAVKGRAPKTGYDREEFGPAWSDIDHNGCDTRNDILGRDLGDVTHKDGTHDCVVLTGVLVDPYGGSTIGFRRGVSTSSAVQIDHLVALSDAWQTGAQQIGEGARKELANDPLNLLAVDGPLNMSKSDGDTATWLPPNKAFRCAYVARQVAVKQAYHLWVTPAEGEAMRRVLGTCPDEPLPTEAGAARHADPHAKQDPSVEAGEPAGGAADESEPAPAGDGSGGSGDSDGSVTYQNCDAARAAGAAPVHRGDPGYSSKLDRDGGGVGCE